MGDSGYFHYVVFLTRHGFAPYRDIIEINTPGSYLTERVAMAVFGAGARGWRVFDLSLLAVTFAAYPRILRGIPIAFSLLAGTLFLAIHAQDGVMMADERDLTAAVLQLVAIAMLLHASSADATAASHPRAIRLALAIVAGFLLSWSACIKPTNLLLLPAALGWTAAFAAKRARARLLFSLAAGAVLPWLVCFTYLLQNHALVAYWQTLHGIVGYYVSLDRKSFGYLLTHACSPILWLFLLALPLALSRKRSQLTATETLLLLSAAAAFLSYLVQAKGFAYQRYPLLIFLLPLLAMWLACPSPHRLWRETLRGCILGAALVAIGLMVHKAATYSHADPDRALMADLDRLGAAHASGSVQCLDYAGSCIETLYKERLVQSTGFIYDCYLQNSRIPAIQALRSRFEQAIERTPPAWIIETNSSCFSNSRTFDKYPDWTTFNDYLSQNYTAVAEHTPTRLTHYWSRFDLPYAYRIYHKK
jgi:hypothetical protein